jgi:hypothetical protein
MVIIDRSVLDEMNYRSFPVQLSKGVYTFTNKESQEGILVKDDPDNECVVVESFAFLNGEQVLGEASAEGTVRAVLYLEGALGLSEYECSTHSKNVPVPVESNKNINNAEIAPYGDTFIATKAIENHPGSIPALLMLQKTDKSLVKHLPKAGNPAYVEGHTMIREANLAFLFNWDNEVVDVREDDFEFSVMVKCTFRFTEGHTVTKTQCGQADKKFSKTLKTDGNPRLILIGDTIKAATTDGIKKCMSELGINQDVYAGEWSKNDKK